MKNFNDLEKFDEKFKMVAECFELCYKEETDLGANWKNLEITQNELKQFILQDRQEVLELIEKSLPRHRKYLNSIKENDIWREGYNYCLNDVETLISNLKK